jgi:phage regulator Rha-like protein
LRDIRRYSQQFNESKIALVDFFIESTYKDGRGETRPCYLVTKKGCEFIANKLTGVKGTAFTAKYINRFHEMGDQLKPKAPQTYLEALKALVAAEEAKEELQAQLDVSKDWYSIKRVAAMNGVDWKTFNWRKLKEKSIELGYGIKKIFDANYGEVNTYHRDAWEAAYPDYEI